MRDYPGTVIMVTHDRYFLEDITEWTLELDRGRAFPTRAATRHGSSRRRSGSRSRASRTRRASGRSPRELDWIRASPKARQAKSKARIRAYEELLAESARDKTGKAQITIPPGPRLGDMVIEADHLEKGFGDRLLIDDLSFKLPPRRHRRRDRA